MSEEKLTKEALESLGIDDLMDIGVDDIEDAAGFEVPPRGAYIFDVTCELGHIGSDDNKKEAVVVSYQVADTLELVNEDDPVPAKGTKFDKPYVGAKGVQYFKTDYKEVGKTLGVTTIGELIEKINGIQVRATLGHQKNKDNPDQPYAQVKHISLMK